MQKPFCIELLSDKQKPKSELKVWDSPSPKLASRPRRIRKSLVHVMTHWRERTAVILGVLVLLLQPGTLAAKILNDLNHARNTAQIDSFPIGKAIHNSQTLEPRTALASFRRATGNVSARAVHSYPKFSDYWAQSRTSRSGKAFEWLEAERANRRLTRMGKEERILVTAIEGAPTDPADLVKIGKSGRVVERFQLKQGYKGCIRALDDPKYARMTIVSHRDTVEKIRADLQRMVSRSQATGRSLSPKWIRVQRALNEGRLRDEIASGLVTRTRKQVERVAEKFTRTLHELQKAAFEDTAIGLRVSKGARVTAEIATRAKGLVRALKLGAVADIALTGYQAGNDIRQYTNGQIGEKVLTAKLAIRSGRLAVAATFLFMPDPTFTTKVIAVLIFADVMLTAADFALDAYVETERDRVEQLLENIDRDERFYAVQRQLMFEVEECRGFRANRGTPDVLDLSP